MTFELDVDFEEFCSGKYELIFDEGSWSELKNKYVHKDLILGKRAILNIDGKTCTLSSVNEDNFIAELNDALLSYCSGENKPTGQKAVYIEFKYVIPLKITLKPKIEKTQTKLKK